MCHFDQWEVCYLTLWPIRWHTVHLYLNQVKTRSFNRSKSFLNKSIRSFFWAKVLTWPLSLCSTLPCPCKNNPCSKLLNNSQDFTRMNSLSYPGDTIRGFPLLLRSVDHFRLEHKQDSLPDSYGPHFRRRTSSSHSMFNLTRVKNIHQSQDHFVINDFRAGLKSSSTWNSWNHRRQNNLFMTVIMTLNVCLMTPLFRRELHKTVAW